jgi:hypothetical protein
MSSTIQSVDLGCEIWLEENTVDVPYVVVWKDEHGCVIMRKNSCEKRKMHNSTSVTTYAGCDMDTYLSDEQNGFLSRFNAATKSVIVTRSISDYAYGDSTYNYISRKCFLPSVTNYGTNNAAITEPKEYMLLALQMNKNTLVVNEAKLTTLDTDSSVSDPWTRSQQIAGAFYSATSMSWASTAQGCRPCLNIALDTEVGENNGRIYLLPSQLLTRKIDFKGKILETQTRPVKVVVQYESHNLNNVLVQVTNNYSDSAPVWVTATSQQVVTFSNESKQTDNWQIGIRCYGESVGYGYFKEPIVKVEVE